MKKATAKKSETQAQKKPKEKWGAPIPVISTPHGNLSLAEAAKLAREGRYWDDEMAEETS